MDTSCSSPRQQQQHHHPHHHHPHHHPTTAAVVIIDRSPARSTTSPVAVCKLTPSQEQQRVAVVDTQGQVSNAGLYVICDRCGQISHDVIKCDFCSCQISAANRAKQNSGIGTKRRLNLDGGAAAGGGSGAGSKQLQPTEAKIGKRTFYGNDVAMRPLLPAVSNNNNVLTVRQAAVTTNGQTRLILPVAAAMQPAKPGRGMPAARRGKREPECLTISISSDEEADAEGAGEECNQRTALSSETPTKENHPASQQAVAEVQCIARVQETPPQSPRGAGRGAALVLTSPPPTVFRSFGRSNPAAPANSEMRFSCRSIRIGSYKVASSEYWVTVSNQGFTFTIRPPRESQEVTLHLLDTDVVQVLGNLSRNMGVLFVCTNRDCAAVLRTKLGMNRKLPGYFDPAGTEESQKRITFLPEPPFSDEQKNFLRQVFPGPLLQEIKQTQANEILIKSSPVPTTLTHQTGYGSCAPQHACLQRASEAVATSVALPAAQPQAGSMPAVTHVVIHNVPSSATIVTRATRSSSSSSSSSAVLAASGSSSVVTSSEQGSSQEESSSGPNIKLLVYPAPPKTGGIAVHSADLRCLREGQFLNDVIIDFYLKYLLLERLSEEVRQRTHIFSSFFYPRLTQRLNPRAPGQQGLTPAARRHRNVRTWTRHVDIFAKDFIVVPINQNAHWFLAVLCFPGLVARACPPQEVAPAYDDHTPLADSQSPAASPKTPEGTVEDGESVLDSDPDDGTELEETGSPHPKGAAEAQTEAYILILDSLRGGLCGRSRIMTTLREYLTEEWKAKKRTQLSFCYGNMHGYTPRTPQQGNYSDCGVYLLQYVESFLEKPPSAGDPVKLELGDWFPEGLVAQKRAAIRDLILDLHLQQHPGSDFPQRWRKVRMKEEAAALRVEEPTSTTLLVTPATNTVILVCAGNSSSQPS
ncbi:sentrin-specific protease 7-like isoform X4 [Dermacentor silvarum]|uniref:sentrin-specific protease 7-like isoform X4 n=1 Tax=Dermacentor silvarum TaxID=543639 RepID=UPI002100F1DB|nr:sentrin-specific protease 7-like isoform X4 [Dermacentor silvarum]